MKRVDLHIRLSEELFKELKKQLKKESVDISWYKKPSMNDLINLLLLRGLNREK